MIIRSASGGVDDGRTVEGRNGHAYRGGIPLPRSPAGRQGVAALSQAQGGSSDPAVAGRAHGDRGLGNVTTAKLPEWCDKVLLGKESAFKEQERGAMGVLPPQGQGRRDHRG
jgi:hypothetical protein